VVGRIQSDWMDDRRRIRVWLVCTNHGPSCGLAAGTRDASSLADALCALADDRETAKTMGARARHLAGQQFDRRQLAGHFVAVIENFT